MEEVKEVDENENKGNIDKIETDVIADVATNEGSGEATISGNFEARRDSNSGGRCGGLGLHVVDDGNDDLGSYWREMGFVWGHQGATGKNLWHVS